ncbi:hypothetical protein cypCar_00032696 [Cyprinus carpio]|nr:hypothetical protein cypCar_00032696 [Cyprinus carpio]
MSNKVKIQNPSKAQLYPKVNQDQCMLTYLDLQNLAFVDMMYVCYLGVMADTDVLIDEDLDYNESRTPVSTGMSFSSSRRGVTVSFHNINYSVKMKSGFMFKRKVTQKNILIELNGIMRPGLNAILGATGSGKSS